MARGRSRKTVAIIQSNYIPWKGYFDIIHDVDEFVFHDDLQYTKGDWRNRNKIKTARGTRWLTVPCGTDERRRVCEVELSDPSWQTKHWSALQRCYGDAEFFESRRSFFEELYVGQEWRNLSEMNQHFIRRISRELLGIETVFSDSRDYRPVGKKQDRLIDLLQRTGAGRYISGSSAKAYVDPQRFAEAGFELVWKDYGGYVEYPQFHPPFKHEVSVLDLIFHTGSDAPNFIWGRASRGEAGTGQE